MAKGYVQYGEVIVRPEPVCLRAASRFLNGCPLEMWCESVVVERNEEYEVPVLSGIKASNTKLSFGVDRQPYFNRERTGDGEYVTTPVWHKHAQVSVDWAHRVFNNEVLLNDEEDSGKR